MAGVSGWYHDGLNQVQVIRSELIAMHARWKWVHLGGRYPADLSEHVTFGPAGRLPGSASRTKASQSAHVYQPINARSAGPIVLPLAAIVAELVAI